MKRIRTNDPEVLSAEVVAEKLEHLRMLLPAVFSDGKVDFEVLK